MEREKLKQIQKELKTLALIYTYLPDEIRTKEWQELLLMETLKERFEFIKFLTHRDVRREADLRNKQLQKEKRMEKNDNRIEQSLLLPHEKIYGSYLIGC